MGPAKVTEEQFRGDNEETAESVPRGGFLNLLKPQNVKSAQQTLTRGGCRALGMSRDRPGPSQGASGPARRPWLHGPEAPHRWRRLASGSGLSLI